MIYDKIEPLTPIKEPTVSNKGLSSIRPSAIKAKPEYAFNTVMTTAVRVSKGVLLSEEKFVAYACPRLR